jgi:hypothetical protein
MRKTFLSMRCILASIFTILTLFSCSPYGAAYIRTKQPAKLHIPNDVNSICFVIRTSLTEEQDSIINSSKENRELYDRNQSLFDISFEGFFDNLKETGRYDNIMYYRDSTKTDSTKLKPLNWVKASNICMKTGSALLIVLEEPIIYGKALVENGTPAASLYWYYKYRIYDPFNFQIMGEYSINERELFNLYVEDTSLDGLLAKKAYSLGEDMATRLKPTYSTEKRIYYNNSNSLLRLGAYYFIKNDYDNARLVWRKLLEKPVNAELAYMACYNISIAEEFKNNLISSFRFANMSYNFLKFSKMKEKKKQKEMLLVNKHIADIKQRILDEDKLNK